MFDKSEAVLITQKCAFASLYLFVVCDLIKVTKDLQIAVKEGIKLHVLKRML